jgi:hypothetical protein
MKMFLPTYRRDLLGCAAKRQLARITKEIQPKWRLFLAAKSKAGAGGAS